ncbi:hypothetical protein OAA19_03580, partial [Rubripirellula sp.]
ANRLLHGVAGYVFFLSIRLMKFFLVKDASKGFLVDGGFRKCIRGAAGPANVDYWGGWCSWLQCISLFSVALR